MVVVENLEVFCTLFLCLSVSVCASGIMPNTETKVLLVQIFGEKTHPMRKYQRIMYWFPKFMHANPFPIPKQLPEDPVDLARFSLTRMANDWDAKVTVYQVYAWISLALHEDWKQGEQLAWLCSLKE